MISPARLTIFSVESYFLADLHVKLFGAVKAAVVKKG
jgi:hypothetical protein